MLIEKINQWVEKEFEQSNCFLVDVKVAGQNSKIQVLVDCDTGVSIEMCAKLSRILEHKLELEKLVPEHYILEVSSPGIGTPFKVRRQYLKSLNRCLELTLQNGKLIEGVLVQTTETGIRLKKSTEKKVKGRLIKTEANNDEGEKIIEIAFEEIKTATEKIIF
ncbi:MAG: hypothetical protein IPM47_20155 [Sphingobacteriales bacterium]|nr:MAG: hypothetical protein IPM47_20155 [Sphingobacteriales bacterium]